jgi:hypothetical protein
MEKEEKVQAAESLEQAIQPKWEHRHPAEAMHRRLTAP